MHMNGFISGVWTRNPQCFIGLTYWDLNLGLELIWPYTDSSVDFILTSRQWFSGVPRVGRGGSRPGRHFQRERHFGKNVTIYVRNSKIYVKNGKICGKYMDKEQKIRSDTGQKGVEEGEAIQQRKIVSFGG